MRSSLNGARAPSLKQVSKMQALPPPVGGWNARDPLPEMEVTDAIILDNLIPGIGDVAVRRGYSAYTTGLGAVIETLMPYSPPSGSNKMFGAVFNYIYDVTASGAVAAPVVTALTSGRWQFTNFATAGGNYLVCANGADAVRNYDGTNWTTPAITNVTSADLISVTNHTQRLWFVEKNKLDPWYLPVSAIAGAATKLTIGPFCTKGGYLQAIGSWSRDGGSGSNDLLVLITSEGEVIMYSGTDPDTANNFVMLGHYQIARPIGRRCIVKTGADLGVLTAVGLVPLSGVLQVAITAQGRSAITDKIRNAFIQSYATAGSNFGWQAFEFPAAKLAIVNVPVAEATTQVQYVMNADTGAWCRFTNMNGGCWAIFNDKAYFGGNNGTVYRYGDSFSDISSAIFASFQQAYTNFGTAQNKRFTLAQPLFRGPSSYVPSVEIKLDYDTSPATLPANVFTTSASLWNVSFWNAATWNASSSPSKFWQTLSGIGQYGSIAMHFSVGQEFALNQINVMYEPGGFF
jgi:hypothetical protein